MIWTCVPTLRSAHRSSPCPNGRIRAAPDPGPLTDGEAKQPTRTDPIE
jgi:hypothetical protein